MKKIVLATDYSESSRESYAAAVSLARRLWARIILVHEAEPPPPLYYEDVTPGYPLAEFHASLQRRLEEEAGAEVFADIEVEPLLLSPGGPISSVIDYAAAEKPDFVIVATHGRTGLAHVLLGSFAEDTMRRSPVPVLVWRPGWPAEDYVPQKVVVPIDFSQNSHSVLPLVRTLAKTLGAEFTFLHVLRPSEGLFARKRSDSAGDPSVGKDADRVREAFEELLTTELAGVPATLQIRRGQPWQEITQAARELEADVILVATHGWTGLKHLLVGSVAERIVRKAHCPVIVVRPTP